MVKRHAFLMEYLSRFLRPTGLVLVAITIWLAPPAFGQDLDVQATLKELLQTMKAQQTQIDDLRAAIQKQSETIQQQQQIIEQQRQDLSAQRSKLDETAAGGGLDAVVQYKVAMELQHVAIFDTRRKDQPAYFERVIGEFRKIIEEWPASQYAPEAQYRIGKIYHRYLKDNASAIREYKAVLTNYPDSDSAVDAREALQDLGGE
ncbi:MAG TPA: tetratricopeptide repeat protein [bacterium]|nr:tetratricopeptide repeat protein [bacterium]HQP99816.1 tetratricopeptide repeat protein [bacterium]